MKLDPHLQREDVVREDDDLVPALLVVLDEELARLEFLGVHAVQQHALARLFPQVFSVELGCHWTPDLGTLGGSFRTVSRRRDVDADRKGRRERRKEGWKGEREGSPAGGKGQGTERTWTFAIWPFAARSIQFASYSLGPIM